MRYFILRLLCPLVTTLFILISLTGNNLLKSVFSLENLKISVMQILSKIKSIAYARCTYCYHRRKNVKKLRCVLVEVNNKLCNGENLFQTFYTNNNKFPEHI